MFCNGIWNKRAMSGRVNVSPEDIRQIVLPVLRHRIAPNFQAQAAAVDSVECVRRLLQHVNVPEVEKYAK